MIRFFNRKSRKKSRDFKYSTSKTSLQNHFTHIQQDSQSIVRNSDCTIRRQLYETAISGSPDYGTYSSVNTGFVGNRPRYSSINALGSRESGQESPPEIVQYLRPPQNYSSPIRDSNTQMKDLPLTLPSPNRPPRSKDTKPNVEISNSSCNPVNLDDTIHKSNSSQMAASRTSPFASGTSSPSYHSPTTIPTPSRPSFSSLKPVHISPSSSEKSKVNKHIESYKIQQGHAASGTSVPPLDLPSSYAVSTRRKMFSSTIKNSPTSVLASNNESFDNRTKQNSSISTAVEVPHRSLPKPPENPSYITSRGNVGGPTSYVGRHAKVQTKENIDYSKLKQRVLVGLIIFVQKVQEDRTVTIIITLVNLPDLIRGEYF